jgi:hypothetical protein
MDDRYTNDRRGNFRMPARVPLGYKVRNMTAIRQKTTSNLEVTNASVSNNFIGYLY